jgi:hypothetical protein
MARGGEGDVPTANTAEVRKWFAVSNPM